MLTAHLQATISNTKINSRSSSNDGDDINDKMMLTMTMTITSTCCCDYDNDTVSYDAASPVIHCQLVSLLPNNKH